MRAAAVLVLALLLLAGCGDKKAPSEAPLEAATGTLRGSVVDAAIAPIQGATVRAVNHTTNTDANGNWRIDDMTPGTYFIEVSKPGFVNASVAAAVIAGVVSDPVRITLARANSLTPYVVPDTWEGFIECSVRVGTGGASGSYGVNACNDVLEQDVNHPHEFPDGTPQWFQMELVWDSTQASGSDLSLIGGPSDCSDRDYHRADGPSPQSYHMDRFELSARGIGPDVGLCSRVFTWTSGTLMHFWGMQLQQQFTTFSHIFYNTAPPPGWQFSVDGAP